MSVKVKPPLYVSLRPFLDHHALSRPTDWPLIFGNHSPVEVEIGPGNGEYIARLAQENPHINYVAFEEYCERISRTLRKLSRVSSDNVRILRLDIRPAFQYLFAPETIRAIHCLYPPPWPKKSDAKHRLLNTEFLRLANSRLVPGGKLKVVTDHAPYARWVLEQVPGSGFAVEQEVIDARYGTKFERKWAEGGQREFYQIILTKSMHADVAVKEDVPVNQYVIERFNPQAFQMPEFTDGKIAVVFRDFLYDPQRQVAQVHVLVHDEHILQNVRILIVKSGPQWRVQLAQGSMLMPTAGIARALECVRDAATGT